MFTPGSKALTLRTAIRIATRVLSSPAVANGVVYVGENDGNVLAYIAGGCGKSQCSPRWMGMIQNEQIVSSSPAVVNGTIYIGSANQSEPPIGRLYVFKLPAP